jgi:coproporphyrinogen III oxidase
MKMLDFVKEMKVKATKGLLEASEGASSVKRTYTFQIGQGEIVTIRGGAFEKAAISQLILKDIKLPGADKQVDGIVYQMEVFPENPYCPMGHFNTNWTTGDPPSYYMNLDLFPAVWLEEDLKTMKSVMDGIADKFGRDKQKMRGDLDINYNMEHWSFPLAAKVGCQLNELKESELNLYITAYQTFFTAYLDIIRKRKDTQFSEEEKKLKLERNGKWLEYYTLKDPAVKMAIAMGIPPEVLIGLGYPPSVIF